MKTKLLLVLMLTVFLLVPLASGNEKKDTMGKKQEALITPSFSETPYGAVNEGESPTKEALSEIVSAIPSEEYESYP